MSEEARPFEEYKEMIQDMSKEEMIRGLYDLSARVIKQENIIDKALYWLCENTHYTSLDVKELVLDDGINLKELLEILDKGE